MRSELKDALFMFSVSIEMAPMESLSLNRYMWVTHKYIPKNLLGL